jgi:hypothetical protein
MRAFLSSMALSLALFVSTECWAATAATVEPVQGQVTVNQGQGFERVDGRVDANVGDSIMVSPDGAATVAYPDGCQVNVQPGAVMTIAPLSPCASGSFAQDQNPYFNFNAGTLLFGALVLGAAGLAVYGITQASKTTSPTSPASP